MKASFPFVVLSVISTLLLTACGGHGEKVHAVDRVDESAAAAIAKAPAAEEVKFDDYGEPVMGGVGGAAGVKLPEATSTEADAIAKTTEALTTAHHGQADATTDNGADATATATTDTPKDTDVAPTPETPATTQ